MSNTNTSILDELQDRRTAIGDLKAKLFVAGITVPEFKSFAGDDVLRQLMDARYEECALQNLLASGASPKPPTLPAAVPAPAAPAPPPVQTPPAPPAPQHAALTSHELHALSWVERINFAQGKLTTEQARALAHSRPGGVGLSEKCLAARK